MLKCFASLWAFLLCTVFCDCYRPDHAQGRTSGHTALTHKHRHRKDSRRSRGAHNHSSDLPDVTAQAKIEQPQQFIDVLYGFENMAYLDALSVSVHSLLESASRPALVRLWVFATERSQVPVVCQRFGMQSDEGCSRKLPSGASLVVQRPKNAIMQRVKKWIGAPRRSRYFRNSVFLRFAVDDLISTDGDVALYMDADTLVTGDVLQLAEEARSRFSNSAVLMARRHRWSKDGWHLVVNGTRNTTIAKSVISSDVMNSEVPNNGIMVFNRRQWRHRKTLNQIQKWIKVGHDKDLFHGGNNLPVVVALLEQHDATLDYFDWQWNCFNLYTMPSSELGQCKILHFSTACKPWMSMSDAKCKQYAAQYANAHGGREVWRHYLASFKKAFDFESNQSEGVAILPHGHQRVLTSGAAKRL